MPRLPTALVAGPALALGFLAAQTSGVRGAGAVVVLAAGAWCVVRELGRTARWRLVVVVAVAGACFGLSHVLAGSIGAWPSVVIASTALTAATFGLVDGRHGGVADQAVPEGGIERGLTPPASGRTAP